MKGFKTTGSLLYIKQVLFQNSAPGFWQFTEIKRFLLLLFSLSKNVTAMIYFDHWGYGYLFKNQTYENVINNSYPIAISWSPQILHSVPTWFKPKFKTTLNH